MMLVVRWDNEESKRLFIRHFNEQQPVGSLPLSPSADVSYAFTGDDIDIAYRAIDAARREGATFALSSSHETAQAAQRVPRAVLWPSEKTGRIEFQFTSSSQRALLAAAYAALPYKRNNVLNETLPPDSTETGYDPLGLLNAAAQVPGLRVIEKDSDDRILTTSWEPYAVAQLPDGSDPRHLDYPIKVSREARREFLRPYFLPDGDLRPPDYRSDVLYYADSARVMQQFISKARVSGRYVNPYVSQYVRSDLATSYDVELREIARRTPGITRVEPLSLRPGEPQGEPQTRHGEPQTRHGEPQTRHAQNDYRYAATLLNPKTNELITIWANRHAHEFEISIAGDEDAFGVSYLDEQEEAEDASPRIHTPQGVNKRGGGYGLMLYAGTAVAVAVKRNYPGVHSTREGDCANRSSSASKIWDKMVENDLAYIGSGDCSSGRTEMVDDFCLTIPRGSREYAGGNVISDEVCGSVEVEYSSRAEMDILPAERVVKQRLVVHAESFRDKEAAKNYAEGFRPPIAKLATAKIAVGVKDPNVIWTFALMIYDAIMAAKEEETEGKLTKEQKADAALIAFVTQPDHIKHLRTNHYILELLGQQTLFGPSPFPRPEQPRYERFGRLGKITRRLGKLASVSDDLAAELHEAALEQLDRGAGESWAASFDSFGDGDGMEE